MALRAFERLAYRALGGLATKGAAANPHLRLAVLRAHLPIRPEAYLAATYLTAILAAGIVAALVALVAVAHSAGAIAVPARLYVFLVPAPVVMGGLVYLVAVVLPDLRGLTRARRIDAKLPYAINFLSTMAAGGSTPQQLFAALARQPIYGPVAEESALLTRDLQLLGMDIISALGAATERSASPRLQDLLQGIATTLTSGGDIKAFLASKADQYMVENRQEQRRFLESLGVLAESFVTVVVAAPLFLIILLSIMTSFGTSVEDTLLMGYALVFVLIPLSQLGFAWALKTMTPEA